MSAAGSPREPGEPFAERAKALVAFLVARNSQPGTARRREHDLCEWIARWRRTASHGALAAQHFAAVELAIILRALNGPPVGTGRIREQDNQQLCWLIARCIVEADGLVAAS